MIWARGNTKLAEGAGTNARKDFEAQPYPISPLILEVWVGGTSVGFPAGTGWDDATGLGTPDVAKLVPDLVAAASH